MRRGLSAATAAAVLASCTGVLVMRIASGPVYADCPPDPVDETGICLSDTVPAHPGSTDPGNPGDSDESPGSDASVCNGVPNGDCVNNYGFVWIGSPHNCYGFPLDPQPEPASPLWGNDDPTQGKLWSCDPTVSVPTNTWFVPDGQPVIDPAQVAQQLVERAPFEPADAKIAPPPSYHTYISYKNWLWIPDAQWHDVTVSLTVAGATVTLTATPSLVGWDMGNGSGTSCVGPGREWLQGMPENAPTNCSYAYDEIEDPKGDTWTVSARISYAVGWTCTGNCGGDTIGELGDVTAISGDSTSITVYQRQTVVN
jgi:hypothetical protein